MKQKLLYICLMILCALAWSGKVWGDSSYKTVTDVVEFNPSGSTLNNVTDSTASFSKSTNITGFVDSGTSASVTFSIGGNISGTNNDLQLKVPTGYQNSRTCTIQRSISSSYYSITFTEVSTAMKASAATTTPTVTLTDANGNSDSEQLGNLTSSQKTISLKNSLKNSNVVMPISVKCEKKAKWTPAVTIFYFYSFTFKYTLSHQELILNDLTEAITNATNLQNSLSNATLKAYMTTAISNANTFKESCRFPSYIDNNVKPSDVDNATAKLNAVKDYVTALNTALSYERTSVPDVIYNQLRQYYGNTPVDPNTKTATELTNTYTKNLNAAITLAENTKNAYATAISHYNAAVTENTTNHNNNSTIATEILNAKNDLEASTTVEAITTAQNKFIAIKAKLEAITAFKTVKATAASYDKNNIPDAVYDLLHQFDDDDPYDDYATADVVNSKKSTLEAAIAAAKATSSPYLTAKNTTLPAKQVQSDNNNPSGIADDDIEDAYEALELATTTQMITDALALVKNFDSITFNGATSIAMGGSITNPASAESTRSISYSVPNSPTIMTVSGTTLNAVAPGQVTVTATTGSTGNGYYKCEKTQVYDILPVFYFSVAAQVGTGGGGSVSLEGNQSSVIGAAYNTSSASLNLKFTATPNDGYLFLGWGTTSTATECESHDNPYQPTLNNNSPGSTVGKTLYAIFEPKSLTLNPGTTPDNSIEGLYKGTITLSRTLKAGYSTIALPFNTTVVALTRRAANDNDWVAQLSVVTCSEADGYTLYFQKVTGGTIEANQPYILHLGTEVVNPTWTDANGITVAAASAASVTPSTGYSGYESWSMCANYEAGFPMAGKYGIVNIQGGLKLGGSGSSLNAFTAYIAGPQANSAPRLRVAYVDEDGTATVVEGFSLDSDEPVAIYGPDGQRRSKMQPGVNIVRYSDGTTRKVRF